RAADIVQRAAGGGAEEIDEKLLFAAQTVFAAVLPETAELGILGQPRKQILHHRRNSVIAAQSRVKCIGHADPPVDFAFSLPRFLSGTVWLPLESTGWG